MTKKTYREDKKKLRLFFENMSSLKLVQEQYPIFKSEKTYKIINFK